MSIGFATRLLRLPLHYYFILSDIQRLRGAKTESPRQEIEIMANANTEHSRKLRAASAAEHRRRAKAAGEISQLSLQTRTEVMEDFKTLLASFGGTRPQALAALCALHAERIAAWRARHEQ